jgi:hypothetical protein
LFCRNESAFLYREAKALRNLARETLNGGRGISDNELGCSSSSATITLILVITLSACAAISAAQFSLSAPILFGGAADGSAGADVGDGFFVGASDEKNNFRLYNAKGGLPARKLDVGVEPAVKSSLGLGKINRTGETKLQRRRKSGRSCSQRNLPAVAKTRSWKL